MTFLTSVFKEQNFLTLINHYLSIVFFLMDHDFVVIAKKSQTLGEKDNL